MILGFIVIAAFIWALVASVKKMKAALRRADAAERALADQISKTEFFHPIEHRIFLDGEKAAGKSALVAKLLNPTTDIRTLQGTQAWVGLQQFLCDEPITDTEHPERRTVKKHFLAYYDVPGETPEELRDLANEKPPDAVIFVIDGTNVDASIARFSQDRIVYFYGAPDIKSKIQGSVIYVSKSDVVAGHLREQTEDRVRSTLLPLLKRAGLQPKIVFGSALTGDRLPEITGHLVESFKLSSFLPVHPSADKVRAAS